MTTIKLFKIHANELTLAFPNFKNAKTVFEKTEVLIEGLGEKDEMIVSLQDRTDRYELLINEYKGEADALENLNISFEADLNKIILKNEELTTQLEVEEKLTTKAIARKNEAEIKNIELERIQNDFLVNLHKEFKETLVKKNRIIGGLVFSLILSSIAILLINL